MLVELGKGTICCHKFSVNFFQLVTDIFSKLSGNAKREGYYPSLEEFCDSGFGSRPKLPLALLSN